MTLDLYVVDAFTQKQFQGNQAAVIPLKGWLETELMQKIAMENNLSETAFIKEITPNKYEIRWFSPLSEIDFCGHATLASSFIIFNYFKCKDEIEFSTLKVGSLYVYQNDDGKIQMSFPNQEPQETEDDVKNIEYDSLKLKKLAPYDVVVTASSMKYDFISRYFWPSNGGDEDPVTGSIHSGLAPYWAKELSKTNLIAYQASSRGGVLYCEIQNDRVLISGFAVLYMQGKIYI
ncbi:PhzF family phenazine biosynthesis protein [Sulfurospirillum arcachonense]|uniref:PhzF family phenazine biosynthesis protein n=1 Tax=Sulfurospirillum arcachonense TaxID=57666 RepID=UPI00046A585D|nr:PhzF family phenazine biosynthesis protein [Sulfurospirillum arcachonense]